MFANVGWGEFFVLVVAALVILGPERLPQAMTWVTDGLRRLRGFASDAREQIEGELGSDLDEFRKPLAQLQELRGMTPRALVTKHLLDGDGTLLDDLDPTKPPRPAATPVPPAATPPRAGEKLATERADEWDDVP